MGREDDRDVCGDIDDAVLGLNAHPAQLDVLRVGRAHLGVVLHRKQQDIDRHHQPSRKMNCVKRKN